MSRRERDDAALEAEIGCLPDLSHEELRKRWKLLFGRAVLRIGRVGRQNGG